ncbi:hypothetical protein NPIL_497031 [Nephila pilipes]|uniref:Uncharacterized protein n=1 Tax=Nephila pilipes TaxID=299642 RepID=A0A8X6UN64_NEPPI|nr:hypothetical protein NPIL_497031 [Nephila pilipes]
MILIRRYVPYPDCRNSKPWSVKGVREILEGSLARQHCLVTTWTPSFPIRLARSLVSIPKVQLVVVLVVSLFSLAPQFNKSDDYLTWKKLQYSSQQNAAFLSSEIKTTHLHLSCLLW